MADLRFGSYLAPSLLPLYQAITDAVGRHLGMSTELVVETSYESCIEDVNDVCFVCSLPYVMFERQGVSPSLPIAAPVLSGARYRGTPVYYSDVIVHRDSSIRSFMDLRGRTWAYNEMLSHSGYGITRYHLATLGEIDGFFGEVIESGFHSESIRMVQDREVDGSAIDSHVLGIHLRQDAELRESIRIIESLGPSTIQPVAVSKRLPERLRTSILDVLLGLHLDGDTQPDLEAGLVGHFTPMGPEAYDDIRRMVSVCEEAGFMELR